MPTQLGKGGNAPIPTGKLVVVVSHKGPDTDLSALQLAATGKVRNDDDFVFFGQPKSPEGGVAYNDKQNKDGGYRHEMTFALDLVPAAIEKIAITLTIDPTTPATFASVSGLTMTVFEDKGGTRSELLTICPEGSTETALILAELYKRSGAWKARHVAQGFNDGLKGIATSMGVTVDDTPAAPAPQVVPTPPPAPPAPKVNLDKPAPVGKVNLTKGSKIDISKGATITATGGWDNTWGKLDYDLFCHIAYKDGTREIVKFDHQVSKNGSVRHGGDLRSGGGSSEVITVKMTDDMACVGFSFYSAIENGQGSFSKAHARVSLDNGEGSTVTLGVSEMSVDPNRYTLYFGTVVNGGQHKVQVIAHESYSRKNSEHQAVLNADGSHTMDAGPENYRK